MRPDKFHPGNADPVLHFHNQSILVATDIENDPVVPANARVPILSLHRVRERHSSRDIVEYDPVLG